MTILCPPPPAPRASSLRIGVFGASRLRRRRTPAAGGWPSGWTVTLATADTQAGGRVADLYPSLAAAYPNLTLTAADPAAADGLDVVFLALPHGASQGLVPELRKRVGLVVDLAADFRLREPDLYPRWYGAEHRCPDLLAEAVIGIPELFPDQLPGATLVAAAGCYPTAAALALAPLVRAGLVEAHGDRGGRRQRGIGGGPGPQAAHPLQRRGRGLHRLRPARPPTHAGDRAGPRRAQVIFTPHLAPMNRGILATCYARPRRPGRPAATRPTRSASCAASTGTAPSSSSTNDRRPPKPPWAPTAPT